MACRAIRNMTITTGPHTYHNLHTVYRYALQRASVPTLYIARAPNVQSDTHVTTFSMPRHHARAVKGID